MYRVFEKSLLQRCREYMETSSKVKFLHSQHWDTVSIFSENPKIASNFAFCPKDEQFLKSLVSTSMEEIVDKMNHFASKIYREMTGHEESISPYEMQKRVNMHAFFSGDSSQSTSYILVSPFSIEEFVARRVITIKTEDPDLLKSRQALNIEGPIMRQINFLCLLESDERPNLYMNPVTYTAYDLREKNYLVNSPSVQLEKKRTGFLRSIFSKK